jgi:hypothetical protein
MDNHYINSQLITRYSTPSTAYWSKVVPQTLLFFVHGFGGSAAGTWPAFPELLLRVPSGKSMDFVFYEYDGRFTQSNSSAVELFNFLETNTPARTRLEPSSDAGN